MNNTLTKWETNQAPIVAIETTEYQAIAVYWGAIIPAIPDLISLEQSRTGMGYETALNQLLQAQKQWISQLYGDSNFTLSWRLITTGNSQAELIFGLVGKTEGNDPEKTIISARNFFNKVRDTFPNGYPLEPCENPEQLNLLRLPFLAKNLAEFRKNITNLSSINHNDIPDQTGAKIDSWIPNNSNFQELFRALVNHPNPAGICINLHSTKLTTEETKLIADQARLYANIASITRSESNQNRVVSSSVSYQEKLLEAEQASQAWTKLQNNLKNPFELTISIISESELPQSIIACLQSAINGNNNQENNQEKITGSGEIILAKTEVQKIIIHQNWLDLTLHRWQNHSNFNRLPWLFNAEEIHSIFRLPIADRNGVWGLPSVKGAKDYRRLQEISKTPSDLLIGNLKLSKKQLTQHLLICGVPGSGKTNTSLYLLEKLWAKHLIPWLVLEPAKTEYRGLKTVNSLQKDLLIFSLGDERVSPFRFNPFELPNGINLDSHLGALLDLFSVSMSMWGPLPNVVEQLIQEAYQRKGFTLLGDNSKLEPPCFSDVVNLIPEIVPKLGYKKETTDEITAAISVRLNKFCRGSLGQMLNTNKSVNFDELMQVPVILEMSQITNSDDRAFIMGLILNRCYQYWTARRQEATGELKHFLLVEEAHNLLGNVGESSDQEQANPKGKAVKNFANMLAEVRGFGQGIAIAEQNPQGLVPDVMVNTNIKIAHRVVESKNRESLANSMLMTPQQEKALASLKVGQFYYYIGGESEPSLSISPNFKDDINNNFNPRLTDQEINQLTQEFRHNNNLIYQPLEGCPNEPELISCIEQGKTLVTILLESPQYKNIKINLMLQLLTAPFNSSAIEIIYPILGKIAVERGINHLTKDQIQATINSAISYLALEAIQEKAKIHGWLGLQIKHAHKLLINALFNPSEQTQKSWLGINAIPQHLLELNLPHPEYKKCAFPGVFRYENKIWLSGDRTSFIQDMKDNNIIPFIALKNWASQNPVYNYLSIELQQSFLICFAIQLTEDNPQDLPYFLE
jgi:DNA helicase HerA-like ATPase